MSDVELFGGTVERSVDGVTYTKVNGVTKVKVPSITFDTQDDTDLDAVEKVKQYRKGWGDMGDFSIEQKATSENLDAAYADQARDKTYYRIALNGMTAEFQALAKVDLPDLDIAPSERDKFTLSGKVSGAMSVTFA